MMYVTVKFNGCGKEYTYKTNLNLLPGAIYNIEADNETQYKSPVEVVKLNMRPSSEFPEDRIRTITKAEMVNGPKRPKNPIKNVWFNEVKGTTVVQWYDGSKTKVICNKNDTFDKEKGIALCFMKKIYSNRGCYYEFIKKWL